MEFSAWHEWTGSEVAFYISTFCELPQYEAAIGQNITGAALQRLWESRMLAKGLARAGVCDFEHQRAIAAAIEKLEFHTPDQLIEELTERLACRQTRWRSPRSPKKAQSGSPRKGRPGGGPRFVVDLSLWDYESLNSKLPPSLTTEGMQRPASAASDVNSERRWTPRPWVDNAGGWSSRSYHSIEEPKGPKAPLSPTSKRFRQQLSSTLREYETMWEADEPVYCAVSGRRRYHSVRPQSTIVPSLQLPGEDHPGIARVSTAPAGASRRKDDSKTSQEARKSTTEPISPAGGFHLGGMDRVARSMSRDITPKHELNVGGGSSEMTEMLEGLLGSSPVNQGQDDSAAGLRGIQKIQAQRQKEKADREAAGLQNSGRVDILANALGCRSDSEIGLGDTISSNLSRDLYRSDTVALEAQREAEHLHAQQEREQEERAAVAVQSKQRQRMAMREAELRRHNVKAKSIHVMEDHDGASHAQKFMAQRQKNMEDAVFEDQVKAARRIQAIHRGNQARAQYYEKHGIGKTRSERKKNSMEESTFHQQEIKAVTKIQSTFRGNLERKNVVRHKKEEHAQEVHAATMIQANFRGKHSRQVHHA